MVGACFAPLPRESGHSALFPTFGLLCQLFPSPETFNLHKGDKMAMRQAAHQAARLLSRGLKVEQQQGGLALRHARGFAAQSGSSDIGYISQVCVCLLLCGILLQREQHSCMRALRICISALACACSPHACPSTHSHSPSACVLLLYR